MRAVRWPQGRWRKRRTANRADRSHGHPARFAPGCGVPCGENRSRRGDRDAGRANARRSASPRNLDRLRKGADEDLLAKIVELMVVPGEAGSRAEDAPLVAAHEFREGALVAFERGSDQRVIVRDGGFCHARLIENEGRQRQCAPGKCDGIHAANEAWADLTKGKTGA